MLQASDQGFAFTLAAYDVAVIAGTAIKVMQTEIQSKCYRHLLQAGIKAAHIIKLSMSLPAKYRINTIAKVLYNNL